MRLEFPEKLKHTHTLTSLFISILGVVSRTLFSLEKEAITLDAFLLLHRRHAGGCAIVDAERNLLGNISTSDFKYVGSHGENLPIVLKPVLEFAQSLDVAVREPIFITLDAPVSDAIAKFDLTNVHRIYVVGSEKEKKPICEVTTGDILQLFATPMNA